MGFPYGSVCKESACNVGDLGSIPGLGRNLEKGKAIYALQYSGLENSMDCIVHGVTKTQTQLSNFHFHKAVIIAGLPWWLSRKDSDCSAGDAGSIPGSGRSPRGGHGNPLQYSCLESTMDRRACLQATVCRVYRLQSIRSTGYSLQGPQATVYRVHRLQSVGSTGYSLQGPQATVYRVCRLQSIVSTGYSLQDPQATVYRVHRLQSIGSTGYSLKGPQATVYRVTKSQMLLSD